MPLQAAPDFRRPRLAATLEANLVDYFNNGVVASGGFTNVDLPDPGVRAPYTRCDFSRVHKEGLEDGRVWRAPKTGWVWERPTGVSPNIPTGVHVDGVFHPTASPDDGFAHYFDFKRGLVVFATPQPTSTLVQAPYAFKDVSFHRSIEPWVKTVVLDGWRYEATQGEVGGVLNEHEIRTPFVVVQYGSSVKERGAMLGSTARAGVHSVLFHVVAEDSYGVQQLLDVVTDQMGRSIVLYGLQARRDADDFELDVKNSPRPGSSTYDECLLLYPYETARILKARDVVQPPLKSLVVGTARLEIEIRRADV